MSGFAALAVMLATASGAQAHAHLVSADPKPTAAAGDVKALRLTFSEGLVAKFSGFDLARSGGRAVAGVAGAVDPKNHKAMTAVLKAPLAAGAYTVSWRAVSADTHRTHGVYAFTVH